MTRRSFVGCDHAGTKIRAKLTHGGLIARTQCKDCGHYGLGGTQAVAKTKWQSERIRSLADLPRFDEEALNAALKEEQTQREQERLRRRYQVSVETSGRQFTDDPYYDSPEWREIRRLVLQRAGGVCEGCGQQEALQAHHLHYSTFGREFLWDLRAVCRECHERVHNIQKETERERLSALRGDEGPQR